MIILSKDSMISVRYEDQALKEILAGLLQEGSAAHGTLIALAGVPKEQMTMAAQVLAGTLNLPLYRVDLSVIVSKYIGETEKNLERLFLRASAERLILLFDTGDALFGERTDVKDSHDCYANIKESFLIKMLATYRVTVISLFESIDEAERKRNRIRQVVVKFPPHRVNLCDTR